MNYLTDEGWQKANLKQIELWDIFSLNSFKQAECKLRSPGVRLRSMGATTTSGGGEEGEDDGERDKGGEKRTRRYGVTIMSACVKKIIVRRNFLSN